MVTGTTPDRQVARITTADKQPGTGDYWRLWELLKTTRCEWY